MVYPSVMTLLSRVRLVGLAGRTALIAALICSSRSLSSRRHSSASRVALASASSFALALAASISAWASAGV
ncbi:hypothetical protein BC831DRAFT_456751 [Entophlyctis helioformis]|nr:hypothetical protein BC831DRAFT_456751 [Entophlyctis helioformis]